MIFNTILKSGLIASMINPRRTEVAFSQLIDEGYKVVLDHAVTDTYLSGFSNEEQSYITRYYPPIKSKPYQTKYFADHQQFGPATRAKYYTMSKAKKWS